jgi:hypothetical protein
MLIDWVNFLLVFRAMSSVMLAEIFLSYFLKGFRDWYAIPLIISISYLLILLTSFSLKPKGK